MKSTENNIDKMNTERGFEGANSEKSKNLDGAAEDAWCIVGKNE